jgi:hypothetical protein
MTVFIISTYIFHSDYSWELRLQSARRLPSDIDTPQGQLATNSKLGFVVEERSVMTVECACANLFFQHCRTDNSLVYPVIRDIEVQRVSKKTKWLYGWGDWVVEVGRDEIWLRGQLAQQENGVQCDLSLLEPNKTVWKVAIYKVSW